MESAVDSDFLSDEACTSEIFHFFPFTTPLSSVNILTWYSTVFILFFSHQDLSNTLNIIRLNINIRRHQKQH